MANSGWFKKGHAVSEHNKEMSRRANTGNKYSVGKVRSEETKRKISEAKKGKKWTEEQKQKLKGRKAWNKGLHYIAISKEKHWNWRGGISEFTRTERQNLMNTLEYKLWREKVFQRDDYTCQMCKKRGGIIHADHIKSWSQYPKLRFVLGNGRTLCAPCHRKTDTYGARLAKGKALLGGERT